MNAPLQLRETLIVVDANLDDYDELIADVGWHGVRTACFATGEAALRAHDASIAVMWIVNARLPDMAGVALLAFIRPRTPWARFFLVGDEYSPDDELAARSAGASAYLCKPVSAAWLEGCSSRRRLPAIRAGPPFF